MSVLWQSKTRKMTLWGQDIQHASSTFITPSGVLIPISQTYFKSLCSQGSSRKIPKTNLVKWKETNQPTCQFGKGEKRISEWFCSAYCCKYIYSRKNLLWLLSNMGQKRKLPFPASSVLFGGWLFLMWFHGFGQVTEIVILESAGNGVDTKSELSCYHKCNC